MNLDVGPAFILTHFAAGFLGFAIGGLVAYKLIMRKMKSRVSTMFNFGDAGSLIDEIAEVEEDE